MKIEVDESDYFDPDRVGEEHGEKAPAVPVAVVRPRMSMSAADFVTSDIPEQRFLVERVWPEQGIGFITGQPKVFKSFLSLDMAFAVATGGLFLGTWQAPEAKPVLVVQMESSKAAFRDRLSRMGTRFGGVPDNLHIISNVPMLLEDHKWTERMTEEIDNIRPSLLILDPLASMTAGDENSAQEMGQIVRLLRYWRDRFACAVCVVHHEVKGGEGRRAGQKMRGSSALDGAREVLIAMQRPDDDVPRVAVRMELKESEAPQPFLAEFDGVTAELRILTEQKLVSTEQAIRELLQEKVEVTVSDVAQALGVKLSIAREGLRQIREIRLKPGTGQGNKPAVYYLERSVALPVKRQLTLVSDEQSG